MTDDVLSVRYSPNGKLLAVALLDSTVKVFYQDTLKFFLSLYGHKVRGISSALVMRLTDALNSSQCSRWTYHHVLHMSSLLRKMPYPLLATLSIVAYSLFPIFLDINNLFSLFLHRGLFLRVLMNFSVDLGSCRNLNQYECRVTWLKPTIK